MKEIVAYSRYFPDLGLEWLRKPPENESGTTSRSWMREWLIVPMMVKVVDGLRVLAASWRCNMRRTRPCTAIPRDGKGGRLDYHHAGHRNENPRNLL